MTLSRHRRLAASLSSAAIAVAVLSACGSTTDHPTMPGMGSSSSSSLASTAAAGDVTFAQMMIPQHEQAIEVAHLALQDRAQRSVEVNQLATEVSKAQGPRIQTMKSWLTSWGASTAMPMDHFMPGMMGDEQMKELETATGAQFDRARLTAMIAHHEGAVTMAKDVLGTPSNDDVRALAQAIVDDQHKEITTMKDVLA